MKTAEFNKLMKKLKWTHRDAANHLLRSERQISRYVNGSVIPAQTAQLMTIYSERSK